MKDLLGLFLIGFSIKLFNASAKMLSPKLRKEFNDELVRLVKKAAKQ